MNESERLKLVLDRQEIGQVLHRYCRAIDRLDIELLKSLYWPDATDAHGTFVGNAHAFADFIIQELRNISSYGFHTITHSIIDISGNIAASEAVYLGYHHIRGGWEKLSAYFGESYAKRAVAAGTVDQEHFYECGGRYIDRFELRSDQWKIARRIITNEWGRSGPVQDIHSSGKLKFFNLPGTRDRDDPVYANLLEART